MKNKTILFITSPIRSHVIPSLYLAKFFSNEFNIWYTVENDIIEELVKSQGYNSIECTSPKFAAGLDPFVAYDEGNYKNDKMPLWNAIKFYLSNNLYHRRSSELKKIVEEIQPCAIFIDIFMSTDLLALYPSFHSKIKMLFFNPMLSTYKVDGFPIVNEGEWTKVKTKKIFRLDIFKLFAQNKVLNYFTGLNPSFQLHRLFWQNHMPRKYRLSKNNPLIPAFENFTEFILAPLEFEFSEKIRKDYQFYLGLCITEDRKDTELDSNFDQLFSNVKNIKLNEGKKIVYCAFGTYFTTLEEHQKVASFLLAVFEALKSDTDIHLIVSANENIQNVLLQCIKIPDNCSLFTRVRQLEALKVADVYITHGGLGSIKEAIYYKVPVLVYPLDLQWDQTGNGLKAEFHGIGLRGMIEEEEPDILRAKVRELLFNKRYKEKISYFNDKIQERYTPKYVSSILQDLLK